MSPVTASSFHTNDTLMRYWCRHCAHACTNSFVIGHVGRLTGWAENTGKQSVLISVQLVGDKWHDWSITLLSSQLSYVMAGYRYFVCPVEFNNDSNSFQVDCEPSELFQLQDYFLPSMLESVTGWVRFSGYLLRFILCQYLGFLQSSHQHIKSMQSL